MPITRPLSYGILHDYDYSSMSLIPPDDSEEADPAELPPLYPSARLGKVDPETVADLNERTVSVAYVIPHELAYSSMVRELTTSLPSSFWNRA